MFYFKAQLTGETLFDVKASTLCCTHGSAVRVKALSNPAAMAHSLSFFVYLSLTLPHSLPLFLSLSLKASHFADISFSLSLEAFSLYLSFVLWRHQDLYPADKKLARFCKENIFVRKQERCSFSSPLEVCVSPPSLSLLSHKRASSEKCESSFPALPT